MKELDEAFVFALKVSFGLTAVIAMAVGGVVYVMCPWILS